MVDAISAYAGLQRYGGAVPVRPEVSDRPIQPDLPPSPGPVERLREDIRNTEIDPNALAARAREAFGDDAVGIVSDTGEVDLDALADRIAQDRAASYTEDLTSRYGSEAAEFVSDRGDVDDRALQDYLRNLGYEDEVVARERERPTFNDAETTGYTDRATSTYERLPGFINVFA